MNYSKKIRTLREFLGLSQDAFGKRIGLTGAYVFRLENEKAEVTDAILKKLVGAFGVDPEWMHEECEDETVRFTGKKVDGANSLGDRIRNMRLGMEMSQKRFAEYAGVQASDINRVEAGKATLGPQTLKRIAEAFHVGVEWLQYGDESKKAYPVDGKMIEYLWKNEKLREIIYRYMAKDGEMK